MSQCTSRTPHPAHLVPWGRCLGRPEPDTVAGRAWIIIEDAMYDGLHGDASGIDDGIAVALDQLSRAGLLISSPSAAST